METPTAIPSCSIEDGCLTYDLQPRVHHRGRFGDAGLRDLAVEPGAVADGSINGVLEGRKYN